MKRKVDRTLASIDWGSRQAATRRAPLRHGTPATYSLWRARVQPGEHCCLKTLDDKRGTPGER